ncbi:MAG: hypothetical protein QOF90_1880 [Acetobacteraceae bacterium]|jgi:hypothetical protein|nr:hypothetical protein [Acetobacteraceae bacterium]
MIFGGAEVKSCRPAVPQSSCRPGRPPPVMHSGGAAAAFAHLAADQTLSEQQGTVVLAGSASAFFPFMALSQQPMP